MSKYTLKISKIALLGIVGLLSSCGGGGGGGGGDDDTLSGQFIDSPVQGISYAAGQFLGTTATNGRFKYKSGNSLLLSIGDIVLGNGIARNVFTPLTLAGTTDPADATVVNIASFLQTLDDDGNPDNGILITEAMRTAAIGRTINFAQSTLDFANDGNVQTVVAELTALTTAGARGLVPAATAEAHLRISLNNILGAALGMYTGKSVNRISNCNDSRFNRTNRSEGSITITDVSFNANGANFEGTGSFSLTVEGSTVREDFEINGGNGDVDFGGNLNGSINSQAFVDGIFQGSARSSFTGLLDGDSLTIVTPARPGELVGLGIVCDLSGSTLTLSK